MRHNAVAIVCNLICRHVDKVKSYRNCVVVRHNTFVIACT
jgi:hypothetical protein